MRARDRVRSWMNWIPINFVNLDVDVCEARMSATEAAVFAANKVGFRGVVVSLTSADAMACSDALGAGIAETSYVACSNLTCGSDRAAKIEQHLASGGSGLPTSLGKLLTCARCRSAWYCDATCQRTAWPTHKDDCKAISVRRKHLGERGEGAPTTSLSSAKAGAFNQMTLSMTAACAFLAVLHRVWGTGALLVEVSDALFESGGPTPDVPMPYIVSRWAVGKSALDDRPLTRRLRSQDIDGLIASLYACKKSPSSFVAIFATQSGDLCKCVLLPPPEGATERFCARHPARFDILRVLRAVVVEPCLGDRECLANEPDSRPALASALMQPCDVIDADAPPRRMCVVFGVSPGTSGA